MQDGQTPAYKGSLNIIHKLRLENLSQPHLLMRKFLYEYDLKRSENVMKQVDKFLLELMN